MKGRAGRAVHTARRVWPFVLIAWRRWQELPPEQKERYRRQARDYAQRGQKALEGRRKKR